MSPTVGARPRSANTWMSKVVPGPASATPWLTTVSDRWGGRALVPLEAVNAEIVRSASGVSYTRLSKLVSQPFELVTVTVGHVPVQPVESVASCPAFTVNMAVRWPAQLSVTELGPEPPFIASTRTTRRGVETNVKLALVGPGPLK